MRYEKFSLGDTGVRWEDFVVVDGDSFASHLVVGGTRGLIRNRHREPSLNTTCDVQNDQDAQDNFEASINVSNPSIRILIPHFDAPNGIRLHGNSVGNDWEWDSETLTTVTSVADSITKTCRRPKWKEWKPGAFSVVIPCQETKPVIMTVTPKVSIKTFCPDTALNVCDAVKAEAEKVARAELKHICDNKHRGLSDSSEPEANTFDVISDQTIKDLYEITASMECRLPGNNP